MKRLLVLAAAALAGCSVGPSYEPPEISVPPQFTGGAFEAEDIARWWTRLGDPALDGLVERALANNYEVKRAVARLREGRNLRGAAIADLLPELDAGGSVKRDSISRNSFQGRQPGIETRHDTYRAGFDASWEIDLWGGKRRALEEADAMLEVTTAELHEVQVALVAEVARAYIELRVAQRQLAIADDGLRGQEEIRKLTSARFESGLATDLDVARTETEVELLRARIPAVRANLERARHALAALLGEWPTALDGELAVAGPVPLPPATPPAGPPADLLARRPDLRRAERQLAAATADIGVHVDAMLPHVNILGSLGLESIDSQLFFRAASGTWTFGPALTWRLLSLPELQCQVEAADARAEQALHAYRQAVVNALREVEDALTATAAEDARRAALARAVASSERAVTQAKDLYRQGLVSLIDVLETDKAWLNALSDLAESEGTVATNRVALYKALGGGWSDEAP